MDEDLQPIVIYAGEEDVGPSQPDPPCIGDGLAAPQARLRLAVFVGMIIRCILATPWPKYMIIRLPAGSYSEEDHQTLGFEWAKQEEHQSPEVYLAKACGFQDLNLQMRPLRRSWTSTK